MARLQTITLTKKMKRELPETALAAINTVVSEDKKSSALRRVIKNTCADITTTQFMLANWKIGGNENQRNMTFNSDSIASL
ncbi:hypothetical protein BA894_16665 [Vibrio natriegens]|nr:hypothetical protein BA894_16665 [Vibrio natriegens]